MTLSLVACEEALTRITQLSGRAADTIEALSELVRTEVHARQNASLTVTLSRVARLLAPAVLVDEERLNEVCNVLEREGDLKLTPGGILYATPTRVVALQKIARVFSSLPTRTLAAALGRDVAVKAATRTVSLLDGLSEAVTKIGGAMITPEAWAGFDRTPPADAAFLAKLDQHLEWHELVAGSLERDGVLEWRAWQVSPEGARWRVGNEGRLWWARTRFGGHYRAWTASGSPSTSPLVELSSDEADRARFALSRDVAGASMLHVERGGERVTIEVPAWLPRPEYRWLSLHAEPMPDTKGMRWEAAADEEGTITKLLTERLGLGVVSARRGVKTSSASEAIVVIPSVPTFASAMVPPLQASALDELIPETRAIMPLLKTLGVRTYRDLLGVDLVAVQETRGVGPRKIATFEDLVDVARRRATSDGLLPPTEVGTPIEPQPSTYDSWSPLSVLGPVSKRVQTIITDNGLATVSALKEWHRKADPKRVENYGRKTQSDLGEILIRLETEGHESLIFRGPSPTSIASLAQCFLERLEPSHREIFDLRFVQGLILEEIGQQKKLTRERIRQIIEHGIAELRPSWGPRAKELLEPAAAIFDSWGGIALTEAVLESLGSPPQWGLELASELADFFLIGDIIPGLSTTLLREEFRSIRRDLRLALSEAPGRMRTDVVQEALAGEGLSIPRDHLPAVSDALLNITIDGDTAFPNRRSVQSLYLKVLREAGGPVSAEDVAQRVNELDPSVDATARTAVAHFQRVTNVFSHSHNKWIHEENLSLSRLTLDALAAHCLPEIEKANGRAVSTRLLLERLATSGEAPTEVTPHILRDALLLTGKVRAWRTGADVAWLGGDITKTTIADWIAEVAVDLEQPFQIAELITVVAQRSGCLAGSVLAQVNATTPAVVAIGRAQYVSTKRVWPTEGVYASALQRVKEVVLTTALQSAESPGLRIPGLEEQIAKFGNGIVWGLASKIQDAVATREHGWFMWPAPQGETLWDVIAKQFLSQNPLFKPSTLRDHLFQVGLTREHVVNNLLAEGVQENYLRRVGMGWYIDSRATFEQQVALLDEQPEIRQMALGSQDFVRESPLRAALNDVRVRHGSFRVSEG